MEIKTISPSKLKQARLCEARLMAKLSDEEYSEDSHEAAKMGNLAHTAAKIWYRKEDSDSQLDRIEDESDLDYHERLIDKVFSMALDEQPLHERPSNPQSIKDSKDLFRTISTKYNRDEITVVFSERRYKGGLPNGVPVHLIIDLGIDRGNGHLEIVDFKTGFLTMNTDEMVNEDQVLLNLLAVHLDLGLSQFTNKTFKYFWVRLGMETGPIPADGNFLADYSHWLQLEYQRLLNLTPETAKETVNIFCKSCGRRSDCVAFRTMASEAFGKSEVMTKEEVEALSFDNLVSNYDSIRAQMGILEDSKKVMAGMLLAELESNQAKTIEGEKFKATKVQNTYTYYRPSDVLSLTSQHGISPNGMLKTAKKAVDDAFKKDPDAMQFLRDNAVTALGEASVRVSGISPKKAMSKTKTTKKKAKATT